MTNATFQNWTEEAFKGYWDGKGKTFEPGYRQLVPAYLAEHFARHLTNRELLRQGKETSVSPKFPGQVPEFMELFNKAYIAEDAVAEEDDIDGLIGAAQLEPSMNITTSQPAPLNQNSPAAAQAALAAEAAAGDDTGATVLTGPADDEEEESTFALGQ